MSDEPQERRRVRILPVVASLALFGSLLVWAGDVNEKADAATAAAETESVSQVIELSDDGTNTVTLDPEDVKADPEANQDRKSFDVVAFKREESIKLLEEGNTLEHVTCEECPYGHFGSSKRISPKSPTFIGYHEGVEIKIRATFDKDFTEVKQLVIVPPADGITPADLELTDDDD